MLNGTDIPPTHGHKKQTEKFAKSVKAQVGNQRAFCALTCIK